MNFRILKKIIEKGSHYYLISADSNIFLCFIECEIKKDFNDVTVQELEKLDMQEIERNIILNSDYLPFQSGYRIYNIDDIYCVPEIVSDVIKELGLKPDDVTCPLGLVFNYRPLIRKWLKIKRDNSLYNYRLLFEKELRRQWTKKGILKVKQKK